MRLVLGSVPESWTLCLGFRIFKPDGSKKQPRITCSVKGISWARGCGEPAPGQTLTAHRQRFPNPHSHPERVILGPLYG